VTATGGLEKQVTFTIDTENNITAFATKQEAGEGESFSTQDELAGLAANWPATRLVEIWNSVPGLTPVKKFTNRKSAVARIWKAIQSLNGDAGGAAAAVAPKQAKKTKAGAKVKPTTRPTPAKSAKGKHAKSGPKSAATARDGSKKAEVVALLQRKGGATLTEIMKRTKWQAHSVRGFISGALGKKMGVNVVSVRRDDGERVYAITQ
jgi:hypothetical protein